MDPLTVFGFEAMGIVAAIVVAGMVLQLGIDTVFGILRAIFWPSMSKQTIDRQRTSRRR